MAERQVSSVDSLDVTPVAEIDLGRYQTSDLVERLVALISVPAAFRRVLKTTFVVAVVLVIVYRLLLLHMELPLVSWFLIGAYSLAAGTVLGMLLGICRVALTAMSNVEAILKTVLDVSGRVAEDYEHVQAGKMRMPPAAELVEKVYKGVVLHAMEVAVTRSFGFLAGPVLWVWRRTIGSAVCYMVKRVKPIKLTDAQEQRVTRSVQSGFASVARYSETVRSFTSSASQIIGKVGASIRIFAMLPLWVALVGCLGLATVPILLVRYFAGS